MLPWLAPRDRMGSYLFFQSCGLLFPRLTNQNPLIRLRHAIRSDVFFNDAHQTTSIGALLTVVRFEGYFRYSLLFGLFLLRAPHFRPLGTAGLSGTLDRSAVSLASRSSRSIAVLRDIASLARSCSRLKSDSRCCALLRSASALRRAAEIRGGLLISDFLIDGGFARDSVT